MDNEKIRTMGDDKTKVSRILVSIGQDFARLGQLLADRNTQPDEFIRPYGIATTTTTTTFKRKPKRDLNAPKKNITSYLHYSNKHRDRLMEAHPDLPQTEIARLLGTEWRGLSEAERQIYVEMALKDKERYETEMDAYVEGVVPTIPAPATPTTPYSPESPPAADAIRPKKKAKKSKH